MELRLNISQKLALSQQMVLSAKILQMSSAELNEYLKELSQSNPVVDYDEKPLPEGRDDSLSKKLEWLESVDEQNRFYYREDREDETENRNFSTPEETFEEHLLSQIRTQKLKPEIKLAAEFAVKSLDENGYLKESVQSLSELTGINNEDTQKAVDLIHTLDPIGTGAQDLKECLLIQLYAENSPDMTAAAIVRDHLDELARNKLKHIASKLGVSLDDVISSSKKIKSLNPKPSQGFPSRDNPGYIVPDACVYKTPSGEYEAVLSDFYASSFKINGYYKDIVRSGDNPDALEYVNEKLRQAQWVLKCIDKRNSTLLSSIQAIIHIQKPFFDKGAGNLVPMKLSDIASLLNIHESTVSRAVRDKYIQCSWGVFPLGYFFSSSVSRAPKNTRAQGNGTDTAVAYDDIKRDSPVLHGGSSSSEGPDEGCGEISRDSIKLRIREIIAGEDKKHPLSDRAIAEVLEGEGVVLSRRTVAKYRESMGIAGTSMRKDF